jgi:hypothetical protein
MKKIIYLFLFVTLTSLTISSCAEEQVTPVQNNGDTSGGGGASTDGKS